MLNSHKIVSLCTTRLNEVENCRFITELNNGLRKQNAALFVYNINAEMYWSDDNIRAESAVFGLVDFNITDVVIVMYERIKNHSVARKIIDEANNHNVPVIIVDTEYENCINVCFDYKKFSKDMVSYGEFWAVPCRAAMEKLIASGKELPEAVICANDIMAINVCAVLNKHGYKVPDDILVTGFDGIDEIGLFIPKLTSSYCGTAGAAPTLISLISDLFAGKDIRGNHYIEPQLIINNSCGCHTSEPESPNDIFGFNNRFYRYQDDYQTFVNMSERMVSASTIEECSDVIFDADIGDLSIIISKKFTDFTQNHFDDTSFQNFEDEMFVFYESNKSVYSQKDFSRKEIVPQITRFLNHGTPLVFNVIAFMNVPIGYICFHLPKLDISDYCKIPPLVSSVGSGIGGFINTMYQHYLTERIEKMYKYDSLTNLYNRLSFTNEFEKMKRSFAGKKVPLNIILIDLDGLKHINDNYGHGAGDNAIRVIATALREACPKGSLCVRFGGDEMLAVIPGKNDPEAVKHDINRRIERYNAKEGKPYLISASAGIYRTDSTCDTDFEHLIKEADAIMYAEKIEKRRKR